MKSLKEFVDKSLNDNLHITCGGMMKPIDTWSGGTKKNPKYTDVHYDNDNDGKWSQGDKYTLTKQTE